MAERQFDVTVIGGGPGGYVAAIRASQLGMKVALVEKERLGGICLNWGCIPSKSLLKSAEMMHSFRRAEEFGFAYKDLTVNWPTIIKRSRDVSERIVKGVEYLMKKNKIEVIAGTGMLTGKTTVQVTRDGKAVETISSRSIILATGARPRHHRRQQEAGRTPMCSATQRRTPDQLPRCPVRDSPVAGG